VRPERLVLVPGQEPERLGVAVHVVISAPDHLDERSAPMFATGQPDATQRFGSS